MNLLPESLRTETYQPWIAQPVPQPAASERIHVYAQADDGSVYHKWFDGQRWNGWENLGHP